MYHSQISNTRFNFPDQQDSEITEKPQNNENQNMLPENSNSEAKDPETEEEKVLESKTQLLQQLEDMEVDTVASSNQNTQEMLSEEFFENAEAPGNAELKEEEPQPLEFVEDESMKLKESTYFQNRQLFEVARFTIENSLDFQHYLKGCLFSPDGCCIIAPVNGDGIHVFELPQDLYSQEEVSISREITTLKSVIYVPTVANIYDFCWYPYMNSQAPETCFWISTSQNEPIKLYDGFNGNLTASYRGYDNVDELESAHSVCFSPDGTSIFGGYKKSIKIFSTSVPGRDYDTINLKQSISSVATNYYQESVLAAGSWNKTISLVDTRSFEVFESLRAHKGGLTFLKFSVDGKYLISGK